MNRRGSLLEDLQRHAKQFMKNSRATMMKTEYNSTVGFDLKNVETALTRYNEINSKGVLFPLVDAQKEKVFAVHGKVASVSRYGQRPFDRHS